MKNIPGLRIVLSWGPTGLLRQIECNDDQDEGPAEAYPRRSALVPGIVLEMKEKLENYFRYGEPIGAIPWEWIDQAGWTDFQRQVYYAISCIPHGETRTYGWVARRLGKAAAGRAVGQALRNNQLPVIIPCHRVVSADSIGGFMGLIDLNSPELRLKTRLISLEEEYRNPLFPFLTEAPR